MFRGPKREPVILPKSGSVSSVTGLPRPDRLKALKKSARNSNPVFSLIANFFCNPKSSPKTAGPRTFGRRGGAVPSLRGMLLPVRGTSANAAGFR